VFLCLFNSVSFHLLFFSSTFTSVLLPLHPFPPTLSY
jgi:hypothetical protein